MKAKEISDLMPVFDRRDPLCWVGLIAMALAERNELLREDMEWDHAQRMADLEREQVARDEDRSRQEKRDELLVATTKNSATLAEFTQNQPIPPRVVFPNEVLHIGCLVREPDGALVIACDAGPIRLDEEMGKRLLALMGPPQAEAKPQ